MGAGTATGPFSPQGFTTMKLSTGLFFGAAICGGIVFITLVTPHSRLTVETVLTAWAAAGLMIVAAIDIKKDGF